MNIVEMIDEINRLVDRTKSARFDTQTKIIPAINLATQKWFNDGSDFFETNQVIRDFMSPLAIHRLPIVPVSINQIIYPDNYVHETAFSVVVDGIESSCRSATYNEINQLQDNSFTRVVGNSPLEEFYKVEAGKTQYVTFSGTSFTLAYLSYLRDFIPALKSDTLISAGPAVLTIGVRYYVNVAPVTHNAVTYAVGATFVAVNTILTGTGNVFAIQNCEIGVSEHQAICQYAAADLLEGIEKFTNAQFKEKESKN